MLCLQVEFYFSDANLPTDKHLLKQISRDPEGYGAHALGLHPHQCAAKCICGLSIHQPTPLQAACMTLAAPFKCRTAFGQLC
jgi:hypothetical protein